MMAGYGATSPSGTAPAAPDESFTGTVTRVVDGDTLWIQGQTVRTRVWAWMRLKLKPPAARRRQTP